MTTLKEDTDTPRVNAIVLPWGTRDGYIAMCDLARTLERELTEAKGANARAQECMNDLRAQVGELDKGISEVTHERDGMSRMLDVISKLCRATGDEGPYDAVERVCSYAEELTRAVTSALVSLKIVGDELDDNADVKDGPSGPQPDWVMSMASSQSGAIAELEAALHQF